MIRETLNPKRVIRICDDCGEDREVNLSSVMSARKYRKRSQDLCPSCGTTKYFRENVLPVGRDSPRWRGGLNKGYQIVYWRDPDTGSRKKEYEHRLVLEANLCRKLTNDERVHHIDLIKTNNSFENLFLCESERRHQIVHASLERCGFKMLGKKVWFNNATMLYGTKRQGSRSKKKIRLSQKSNIRRYGDMEYEFCYCPEIKHERPKHVLIAEKLLDRRLYRNEVVHHLDGNGLNNDSNNLVVMTISQHRKSHKSIQACAASLYQKGLVIFEDGFYRFNSDV